MGIKDKITDTVDKVTGDDDTGSTGTTGSADVPKRQPDGDPPVPPVQVSDSEGEGDVYHAAKVDPSAKVE